MRIATTYWPSRPWRKTAPSRPPVRGRALHAVAPDRLSLRIEKHMNQLEAAALTIALLFSATFAAHAQGSTYPDHPVTLIVPFSAGGDADVAARSLAVVAQQVTGQVHVPVNRAGASGAIGSLAVRNARPDGYTLLLARVGSQVVLP